MTFHTAKSFDVPSGMNKMANVFVPSQNKWYNDHSFVGYPAFSGAAPTLVPGVIPKPPRLRRTPSTCYLAGELQIVSSNPLFV
jgi:hypothetical protein